MKKILLISAIFCYSFISAQIKTPQPSPTATISQQVGVSNITVEYSRPGAKKRKIFGDLVPFDKMWRTGANKATKITFEEDVIFGGQKIRKGSYSLFTIPDEKAWKILLNKETELWGVDDYDESAEVFNQTIETKKSMDFVESLTIDFGSFEDFSAVLSIKWANTIAEIEIKSMAAKKIEKQYYELLTNGLSANDYYNGAKFFANNSTNQDIALQWINIAIKRKPEAFWMVYHKARILKNLGEKKEAANAAELVIDLASKQKEDYGYIKRSEDLIKSMKSK
jgi:tetratricopeptide (TPR) repeat protein